MKLQRMETPKVQEVLMMIYDCRNKKRPKDSVVFEPADNESFAFHVPEIVHMRSAGLNPEGVAEFT